MYILVPVLQVVFQECVKDQDPETVASLLRRVSVDIDVNRINTAGMTALHQVRAVVSSRFLTFKRYFHIQAVLDNNLALVRLLVSHGSDVNIADTDSWTPLHAAAANGHHGAGDGIYL